MGSHLGEQLCGNRKSHRNALMNLIKRTNLAREQRKEHIPPNHLTEIILPQAGKAGLLTITKKIGFTNQTDTEIRINLRAEPNCNKGHHPATTGRIVSILVVALDSEGIVGTISSRIQGDEGHIIFQELRDRVQD